MMQPEVIIIGAGLAGLSCALHLQQSGLSTLVLEAGDAPGGRVRTDKLDGFLLDRGFQVLLTAYPDAQSLLDYNALKLHYFYPGSLIRLEDRFHKIGDPFRRLMDGFETLIAPIGHFQDKLNIVKLRQGLRQSSLEDILSTDDALTTLEALQAVGFSELMIRRFFRPFLSGIFLEPELTTSSRMFHFIFKMFSEGHAALPAQGMQAIPEQLAARLQPGSLRLNARVSQLEGQTVYLQSGEALQAKAIVVAVDPVSVNRLLPEVPATDMQGVTTVYFAAPKPPVSDPILVLNGTGDGLVNDFCVKSAVCPSLAPDGKALLSATVLGVPEMSDAQLEQAVRQQMRQWYGDEVSQWQHLRTYRISGALPTFIPGQPILTPDRLTAREGVYYCGDYCQTPSLQGALRSGRLAGEAVLTNWSHRLVPS